ncbi:aminotransferase class V-fold PLP-dependent enzyme [Brucella intermedia]|uniref:aminotransferase class V-fold PLP-dependent enzyme n=1 Tax=Brucella intermedia TaxID=94625 RepID=UPI00224B670A|nr:aminotransferase class V-fold PLP-dependent enzyme [Brucella intermedia]
MSQTFGQASRHPPRSIHADYDGAFREHPRYLNFASLGPVSEPVIEASDRLSRAAALADAASERLLSIQQPRALASLARLSRFRTENITLVPNTSMALVQVALGLPEGTRVVAGRYQFPANVWPWRNAAASGRITAHFIGALDEPVTPELVAANLGASTDVVSISAVDFRTGYRADLARIREAIGDRLLVIDAIQAFGVIEEDWTLADIVVAGGQKWMRAGQGTGFMALSDSALERLLPLAANWAGIEDSLDLHRERHVLRHGAARFDATRLSPVLSGCFAEALELIEGVGPGWIATEIAARYSLIENLAARNGLRMLSEREPARRAGIAVIEAPSPEAALRAVEAGFSFTRHDALRLRFSLHASTRLPAVEELISVLAGT